MGRLRRSDLGQAAIIRDRAAGALTRRNFFATAAPARRSADRRLGSTIKRFRIVRQVKMSQSELEICGHPGGRGRNSGRMMVIVARGAWRCAFSQRVRLARARGAYAQQ
jgi:hypothetical protein